LCATQDLLSMPVISRICCVKGSGRDDPGSGPQVPSGRR
jgi:hypothetical protein